MDHSDLEATKTPELDMFLTIDDMGRVTRGTVGLASIDVGMSVAE